MAKLKTILAIVYLSFGFYSANIFFKVITKPQIFPKTNGLIIGFGGILLIISGLKSLFSRSAKMPKIKNLR